MRSTIHATSNLTSLLVAPAYRSKIGLIIHEATVKVRLGIWVGRCNMDLLSDRREIAITYTIYRLAFPRLAGYSLRRVDELKGLLSA